MKTGYIYQVRNKINGKSYIGLTTKTLNIRRKTHEKDSLTSPQHFHKAIRLYGWSNFEWNILEKVDEENSNKLMKNLNEKEIYWIRKFDTFNKGYNSTVGGDGVIGYKHTEEALQKLREATKGENNPNYGNGDKIRGSKNPMYGKTHSEETLKKMKEAKQGENNSCFGRTGDKHPMYGKKRPEHSKRMTGKNNPMWGRKHTEESKLKMGRKK